MEREVEGSCIKRGSEIIDSRNGIDIQQQQQQQGDSQHSDHDVMGLQGALELTPTSTATTMISPTPQPPSPTTSEQPPLAPLNPTTRYLTMPDHTDAQQTLNEMDVLCPFANGPYIPPPPYPTSHTASASEKPLKPPQCTWTGPRSQTYTHLSTCPNVKSLSTLPPSFLHDLKLDPTPSPLPEDETTTSPPPLNPFALDSFTLTMPQRMMDSSSVLLTPGGTLIIDDGGQMMQRRRGRGMGMAVRVMCAVVAAGVGVLIAWIVVFGFIGNSRNR
ncbi:hypothetical protein HDV00_008628 [Rhizophlyctis rosea]|nr:hypothetical protein HDV00_008628 [Rhizophlyctis rosea]